MEHLNEHLTTLVVSGGRRGVGATTLAVQLAAALAQEGQRVVLVDADLGNGDLANSDSGKSDPGNGGVAAQCEHLAALGIADVMAGHKTIHEVLQRGPAGMQILAGAAAQHIHDLVNPKAIVRLLKQMRSLGPHADWLIVDAGNQPSEMTAELWSAADRLLMVTSPDAAAVMDTYALIKTLLSSQSLRQAPALIVNQAADEATAADVHRRIDQSCRRFLGVAIEFAGWLPMDPSVKLGVMAAAVLAPAVIELAHRLHERRHSPARHPAGRRPLAA